MSFVLFSGIVTSVAFGIVVILLVMVISAALRVMTTKTKVQKMEKFQSYYSEMYYKQLFICINSRSSC